jgi:hypothetical protein
MAPASLFPRGFQTICPDFPALPKVENAATVRRNRCNGKAASCENHSIVKEPRAQLAPPAPNRQLEMVTPRRHSSSDLRVFCPAISPAARMSE